MHFLHRADGAGLDDLDDATVVVAGVDLSAHLSDAFLLCRGLGDQTRFLHRVRQRLLAEDVQTGTQGRKRRRRVHVVRRRYRHAVQPLLLDQLAKIDVILRLGEGFLNVGNEAFVDVGVGDDLGAAGDEGGPVRLTHAAGADDAELEFVAGGGLLVVGGEPASPEPDGASRRAGLQESPTCHSLRHDGSPVDLSLPQPDV